MMAKPIRIRIIRIALSNDSVFHNNNDNVYQPKACRFEVQSSFVRQYERDTVGTRRLNCCDASKLLFFLAQQIHRDRKVIADLLEERGISLTRSQIRNNRMELCTKVRLAKAEYHKPRP